MAQSANKLKTIRGTHRGWVTKVCQEVKDILSETVLTLEKEEKLLAFSEALREKRTIINQLNEQIQNLMEEEQLEEEITKCNDEEFKITKLLTKLRVFEQRNKQPEVVRHQCSPDQNSAAFYGRLPSLDIPKFNGDPRLFSTFWDLYEQTIHRNPQLSNIQKFTYLKTLLSENALACTAGIRVTGENYETLISTLKNRFEKPDLMKDKYLHQLINLHRVSEDAKHPALRKHHDYIMANIISLKSVGVDIQMYGELLIPIIMKSLPHSVALKISEKMGNSRSLDEVMDTFLNHIENQERCESLTNVNKHSENRKPQNPHKSRPYENGPRVSSAFSATSQPYKNTCAFCMDHGHFVGNCPTVVSVDDRLKIVKDNHLCYNCLKTGHNARRCPVRSTCQTCRKKHHIAICFMRFPPREPPLHSRQQQPVTRTSQQPPRPEGVSREYVSQSPSVNLSTNTHIYNSTHSGKRNTHICLQTGVCFIRNTVTNKVQKIRILFDQGSMHSYISAELAQFLELPIVGEERFEIQTFGSSDSKNMDTKIVNFQLERGNFKFKTNMYCAPYICQPLQNVPLSGPAFQELSALNLADPGVLYEKQLDVSMLVGCDLYWNFVDGDRFQTLCGPKAVWSSLGYLLSGPLQISRELNVNAMEFRSRHYVNFISNISLNETFSESKENIEFDLEKFHDVESLGISLPNSDDTIMTEFENTVEYVAEEKRYQIRLPWKDNVFSKLPDNKWIAEKRLDSLLSRLNRMQNKPDSTLIEQNICQEYQKIIHEQERDGIICKLYDVNVSNKLNSVSEKNHLNFQVTSYLPHKCVIKDSVSTPVRVVFDGSVMGYNKMSLNKCLLKGPSLIADLSKLILQFRCKPVALTADISRAYLQIKVHPDDQNALRFLWKENGDPNEPLLIYKMLRLPFGLNCSPFLLQATLNHHFKQFSESHPVCSLLESKFYMDDLVSAVKNESTAISMYDDSMQLMSLASMELKKWNTNSLPVRQYLKSQDPNIEFPDEQSILGVKWDAVGDTLKCSIEKVISLANTLSPSKRNILRIVAKVFDPMGLLSIFLLPAKRIFQELCKVKLSWDESLPENILSQWEKWVGFLAQMKDLKIHRYLFHDCEFEEGGPNSIEIHAFCDASMQAYTVVIYAKVYDKYGNAHVKFLISKTRVSPLKQLTLPRLELMAALLCVRLTNTVANFLNEMCISAIHFYSDSQNVLYWIKGEAKSWSIFVAHRLREIHAVSQPNQWHYVNTKVNPADFCTRVDWDISNEKLGTWFEGPKFLKENTEFSFSSNVPEMPCCLNEEMKKSSQVNTVTSQPVYDISNVITLHKYSTYDKLMSVTYHVLKAVESLKKVDYSDLNLRKKGEILLIKSEQNLNFPLEIKFALSSPNENIPACEKPVTPLLKQFHLFKDENNLLRIKTRFENVEMPFNVKYPILLPKDSYLTKLIIMDKHVKGFHCGVSHTLSLLRDEFWVASGRRVVRNVIGGCLICVRLKAEPYVSPSAPALPKFRVTEAKAFTYTATDFLGPIYVKQAGNKAPVKSYVALFTCCTTRAVKLELVSSLSTECFILALRRFISVVGKPRLILSDNAKSYIRASKELRALLNPDVIRKFCLTHRMEWRFILPKSPHWNGLSERLVKSVKAALRPVLSRSLLDYEEISTVLTEVASLLNTRPLVYVSGDANEPTALTPAQLMYGENVSCLPPLNLVSNDDLPDKSQLATKRLRYLEKLQNAFWHRWRTEYLSTLNEHHFHERSRGEIPKCVPKVGEVVIIKDAAKARYLWKLGRIVNIFPGRDNKIRSIEVKPVSLGKDDKRISETIKRPPHLLIPLELNSEEI